MQTRAHKRMLIVPKRTTDRRCKWLASTNANACVKKYRDRTRQNLNCKFPNTLKEVQSDSCGKKSCTAKSFNSVVVSDPASTCTEVAIKA